MNECDYFCVLFGRGWGCPDKRNQEQYEAELCQAQIRLSLLRCSSWLARQSLYSTLPFKNNLANKLTRVGKQWGWGSFLFFLGGGQLVTLTNISNVDLDPSTVPHQHIAKPQFS